MSCTHTSTKLLQRRHRADWVSFRYECLSCGERFTKYEPRVFKRRPMPVANSKSPVRARQPFAPAVKSTPPTMPATPREIAQIGKIVGVRLHRIT